MENVVRDACPTGMQLDYGEEGFPHLSPYPPIPLKTMEREFIDVVPNKGCNHCLYYSIADLYKETLEMPYGRNLKERMDAMAKTYTPKRPEFETGPWYLRHMFLNFLWAHFDDYFKQQAFQDTLVDIARKTKPGLTNKSPREEISMAYRNQMLKKQPNDPSKPFEFAGMVELDIASELFGMKIGLWVVSDADPSEYMRMHVFLPKILCNTVDENMWIYQWNVLNTGNVHFEHIKMWIQPLDKDLIENQMDCDKSPEPAVPPPPPEKPPSPPTAPQPPPAPTKKTKNEKSLHWDPELDGLAPGAKKKIGDLAVRDAYYTLERFRDWVIQNFPDLVRAGNSFVVYAFYAAYLEYANAPDPPWWERAMNAASYFFFGTGNSSQNRHIVDEVFAKAEARKLRPAQ